ncbi:beta-glycosyltransferase [Geobacillus thermopakistaniensis]|uniref:Beta-glycosyltransferase n=1 Tax=Geobacillus thermopakistaniensis (strain MAS1) TaxID=1408282 RepID=A0A7U9P7V4_GEOTM|nr:glycosyltransferase family 2 protein [Geobacillus sp. MAS1]ESU73770.1 beta-glycosyltransferase [Geobacillus sp. MAS1]
MDKINLTIFTPTYNRGYILKNCYESLCRQINKNFIWLIVDDGSTDNTEELVNTWIKENRIKIVYIKQKNAGKHVAHNTGVLNCNTEMFVCVDSDDYLTDDAVKVIYDNWGYIKLNNSLAGMIALRGHNHQEALGTRMPKGINKCKISDLYQKYGFKGDTMMVFKTDILKRNLFPVFEGEKFVTEAVIYDKIDQNYEMMLLDKILYICEYLEDGYSRNIQEVHRKNPIGYIYFLTQRIEFAKNRSERYRAVANYLAGCWSVKYKHPIKNSNYKMLCILAFPKAIYIYIKRSIKIFFMKLKFWFD